jgi:hypothetical protein
MGSIMKGEDVPHRITVLGKIDGSPLREDRVLTQANVLTTE